jgi:4-amino-4-deoxy-L-arabinose transferase-like glycosyltransferase
MCNLEIKTVLVGLFVFAVVVRMVSWVALPDPILSTNASIAYLGGADLLLDGDGFRDPTYPIFTPPLYAVFIAGGSILFGNNQLPIKVFQVIVDGLMVVIIYLITEKVFDRRVAVLSSVAWAIYPFAIYPTIYIGSETIFTFLLGCAILFIVRALHLKNVYDYLLTGCFLGLATMVRGTTQFLPLLLPLVFVSAEGINKHMVMNYLILCLVFATVLLPWGMRNYLVLGKFIPVANASGVFLYGASDKFLTIDERDKELPLFYERLRGKGLQIPSRGSSLVEKDTFQLKAAMESYKEQLIEDPLKLILFLLKKCFRVWYATESGRGQGIILAVNLFVYPFAIVGMVISHACKNKYALGLIGLIGYFVVLHSLALPLFRYMIPIMPYVLAFAVFGAFYLKEKLIASRCLSSRVLVTAPRKTTAM